MHFCGKETRETVCQRTHTSRNRTLTDIQKAELFANRGEHDMVIFMRGQGQLNELSETRQRNLLVKAYEKGAEMFEESSDSPWNLNYAKDLRRRARIIDIPEGTKNLAHQIAALEPLQSRISHPDGVRPSRARKINS